LNDRYKINELIRRLEAYLAIYSLCFPLPHNYFNTLVLLLIILKMPTKN